MYSIKMDSIKSEVENYIKLDDYDKVDGNKYADIKNKISGYEILLENLSDQLEYPDKYYDVVNGKVDNILTDEEFDIYTQQIKLLENSDIPLNLEDQMKEYIYMHYLISKCKEYLANKEMKVVIKN